ncbi:alpha/beta fold hydrolase [Clostridium tunisiense]|uniref:alpha/beta fold hydrolase n=1 Tax=Clostridium tunisiense TaxID=219748 RepID=UPI00030EC01C|nr:alpha/beta hydrolase [Clostridium tunisiense]
MRKTTKLIISGVTLLIIASVFFIIKYNEKLQTLAPVNGKVDIGGYGLNVKVEGKGTPTVIFESGLGGGIGVWTNVQPEISKITRTFSYDRAGLGESDKSTLERTSSNQVRELHELLQKTKVKGPYIIVAHSIGGFNARLFADSYPEEVAGIIFVDAAHEEMFSLYKLLAPKEYENTRGEFVNPEGTFDDLLNSAAEVRKARRSDGLRNIPITVLSAENTDLNVPGTILVGWAQLQRDIATLSDNSKQITVKGSGHMIQDDNPQAIIDEIKYMINNLREK